MTSLSADFPLRSQQSVRHPSDIRQAEKIAELNEETRRRNQVYPRFIKTGSLSEEAARHQQAVWSAITIDYQRLAACSSWRDKPDYVRFPFTGDWRGRVAEIRRELQLRRNAYPKWIAAPTNSMDAATATRKLEVLDAIHDDYWCHLRHFHKPLAITHPQIADLPPAQYYRQQIVLDRVAEIYQFHANQTPALQKSML